MKWDPYEMPVDRTWDEGKESEWDEDPGRETVKKDLGDTSSGQRERVTKVVNVGQKEIDPQVVVQEE